MLHKTCTTPIKPQSDGLVKRFNRTLAAQSSISTNGTGTPNCRWSFLHAAPPYRSRPPAPRCFSCWGGSSTCAPRWCSAGRRTPPLRHPGQSTATNYRIAWRQSMASSGASYKPRAAARNAATMSGHGEGISRPGSLCGSKVPIASGPLPR